jgi:hypothetical protein
MYRLQTNFFGGDCTLLDDTDVTFSSLEEAVGHVQANKPPSEFEWDVRVIENGRSFGSAVVWTRYGGEEINYWKNGKIVTINPGGKKCP